MRVLAALLVFLGSAHAADAPPLLSMVNRAVNGSMEYRLAPPVDRELWTDVLARPCPARGDCKDYAVCKCWHLHRLGIPCAVVVEVEPGVEPHAIALAQGWALDNKAREPYPWREPKGLWGIRIMDWNSRQAPVLLAITNMAKEAGQ